MGLFEKKTTRQALAMVLSLVGGTIILFPDKILTMIGGSIYLWESLVGAGFVTAGLIAIRIINGINPKVAVYEGFFIASVLSWLVIITNFSLSWLVPGFASVLIGIFSLIGLFVLKSTPE